MDAPEPTVKLRCISPLLDPPYTQLRLLRHAQLSRRRQPIGVKARASEQQWWILEILPIWPFTFRILTL